MYQPLNEIFYHVYWVDLDKSRKCEVSWIDLGNFDTLGKEYFWYDYPYSTN